MDGWEKNTVISELKHGKELTNMLKKYLNPATSSQSSPSETCKILIEKILSSHEKALSMLNFTLINHVDSPKTAMLFGVGSSPQSDRGSTDDQDFKGRVSKKRKVMDKWGESKRVCMQNGQDQGPQGDGFNWRKYGQKVILGSNYPRGYFRCTHRNVQGCLATKQVQRSDGDSNFVEIKYRGRHTCNQAGAAVQSIPKVAALEVKQVQAQNEDHENAQAKQILTNLSANLKVKTEGLDKENPIFTFPSTAIESHKVDSTAIFSDFYPIMQGGDDIDPYSIMGQYSPTFISPTTTSESNYFSTMSHESPRINSSFDTARYYNPYYSRELSLTDFICATTSVTNSPMPIGNLDVFGALKFDEDDVFVRFDEDSSDFRFD